MSDQTLKQQNKKGNKILIEGTKENILNMCDTIFKMRDDIYAALDM